ncbi:MAG TPA: hypothetical protein VNZ54_06975 [bacterium]|nr:hypothetical protein [bacterium]
MTPPATPSPPGLDQLLCLGGDARIACDPATGLNAYGCPPRPRPDFPAYGSCTASTVSSAGAEAATAVLRRLASGAATPAGEFGRLRSELARRLGLEALPGCAVVFAASGTDLHLLAAQLAASTGPEPAPAAQDGPLTVLMAASAETGCGVPAALEGRHSSARSALAGAVPALGGLAGARPACLLELPLRGPEGAPLAPAAVDAAFEAGAAQAVAAGRRVLLVLSDLSKTGLLAPSPGCARALRRRFGPALDVLVDACQFRLSPASLRAYLRDGAAVAITGSKFATGPAFCGALVLPPALAQAWQGRRLPPSLAAYSARADWPEGWAARHSLDADASLGLLLRWEAALAELKAFQALPEGALRAFLLDFAAAVQARLGRSPALEPLPAPALARGFGLDQGWDAATTIFPFLLRGSHGYLGVDEVEGVYQTLMASHGQVGRPLRCGERQGRPLSALRLCNSMRLAVEALGPQGRGPQAVIAGAIRLLDAAEALAAAARA